MTQEQTEAYAKGFKDGWDKADERILKIINDWYDVSIKLPSGLCLAVLNGGYLNKLDLIKAIKNQGDDALGEKDE